MTLVVCEGLSKHYGSVKALNSLSLTIEAGPPVALIGPNGAGKTTLFSVLCGYLRGSTGAVQVMGHKPGANALVGKLSAMPQDALMDPQFTIGRQLVHYARLQGLSKTAAKADTKRVLDLVQLPQCAAMKPESLSHGMRKRVALAQALLGEPQLVLLDEPTAGIDPPNVKIIRDLVARLSSTVTFVISSHNLDELEKLCQSVIYLEHGELKQTGSVVAPTDEHDNYLTVRLATSFDDERFESLASGLSGVESVVRLSQGDFRLQCDAAAVVDEALLASMRSAGIQYRQLVRGLSLEDRLYGQK